MVDVAQSLGTALLIVASDILVTVLVTCLGYLLLRREVGKVIQIVSERSARLAVTLMQQAGRTAAADYDERDRARVARLEQLMAESRDDRAALHAQIATLLGRSGES